MTLDRDPVVQGLKWKIGIRRCLNLDYDQAAGFGYGQKVDNVPVSTHETRHLRINMPRINRRNDVADCANELGLQPALRVSEGGRTPEFLNCGIQVCAP